MPLTNLLSRTAKLSSAAPVLAAAVRPCLETLENRLLMDGEFGSLVTRGGTGADVAYAAAYDADGNGVVAGSFSGTVDFAPGDQNVMFDAANGNGYVAKYNASGGLVWARRLGGAVADVAVDNDGNILVTGSFAGTKDFDSTGGTTNLTSAGFDDVYVAKFSAGGTLLWAKRVGGAAFSDFGMGVGTDAAGNVYVGGQFSDTVDFNPGHLTVNRTATLSDGFVLKLTKNGNFVRVSQLAGAGNAKVNDIAVTDAGTVYATGRFDQWIDADPGAGNAILVSDSSQGGNYDGFLWKIDADGSIGFGKRFGGGFWDEGQAVAVDAVGNAYVTGKFTYSAQFAYGTGGTLNAFGGSGGDAFVAKYDSEGGFAWAKKMGGGEADESGMDIAIDGGRNVYVTGYFRGIGNLNPNGWGLFQSAGLQDAFVAVLSTDGGFHHAVSYGGTGDDLGRAIAVDAVRGNVWVAGQYASTVDFDPKAGVQNRTSAGGHDAYLLRLRRTASPLQWALSTGFGASPDEGRRVAVDADGNVYMAGVIRGMADVDPTAGYEPYGPIGGGGDVFVSKFAPDGSYLWSRVAWHREDVEILGDEKVNGLAVDADGNVIVVGNYLTTAGKKLDLPNTNQDLSTVDGYTDAFIWKLDKDGGHVFAKSFGGEGEETADGVAVDADGNVYVTGMFDYDVRWGPGADDVIESSNWAINDLVSDDVYVAKFSPSGTAQWAVAAGSGEDDRATGIAVDSARGYVHVVGTFAGDTFHANHAHNYGATIQPSGGALDTFVARYSTAGGGGGQVNRLGGTGTTRATAIDVDPDGNAWVGGEFTGTVDLNPKGGVSNRTSAGDTDAFLVKLDAGGNYLTGARAGAASLDTLAALDVGADGRVLATGYFRNNVDFNPSAVQTATLNGGSGTSFAWRLDGDGSFRAAHKFAPGAADVAVGPGGMAHVVGSFYSPGNADFDPGSATTFTMQSLTGDAFLMKFQPGTTPSTQAGGAESA